MSDYTSPQTATTPSAAASDKAAEAKELRGSGGAKAIYDRLESLRFNVLERMRDCSALTLPSLIPPQGDTDQQTLPEPYQSVGARGVNNLSSKLLLALLPPGMSCFRMRIANDVKSALGSKLSDVEAKLADMETT